MVNHGERGCCPSPVTVAVRAAELLQKGPCPAGTDERDLYGIPRDTQVAQFAKEKNLEHLTPLLQKGALIAQNPSGFESFDILDDADRDVIRRETTHKVGRSTLRLFCVRSRPLSSKGWDQTDSNGANLSFPDEFGISTADPDPVKTSRNQWIDGVVNAAPCIATSMLGCWTADPLNNLLGRRGAIFISAFFCTFSVIGFVTRILMGIGMRLKASTVPVFSAENTAASIRGGAARHVLADVDRYHSEYSSASSPTLFLDIGKLAWRFQLGSAFVPAVPLLIGVYFCPESPRWLMKKDRYPAAYASLCRLRMSELQAARDLYYVHYQLMEEFKVMRGSNCLLRFAELFTVPRVHRATIASRCAANIIAFYSSTIFQEAGYGTKIALLASFGFGLVNFVFVFPAVWTIGTFGRRNLLLSRFPNMAWSLLAAACASSSPRATPRACRASRCSSFAAFYSPGEGPVPFTYSAEVFPLAHREMGMSWFVPELSLGCRRLRLLPRLQRRRFFMIFFLVPETKQRTLEELDYVFFVPVTTRARYQLHTALPHFVRRFVLRRRDVVPPPLYNFDEVESITVWRWARGARH
ncbi:hypothetical protein B0H10DRAFT_2222091 [Mycena sp. CBHHK59/15]|nr:hypothetical protein B0H10DRAFT_2222091 [Mycena sp. CBHHK59/15]